MTEPSDERPDGAEAIRRAARRELPRRFYKQAGSRPQGDRHLITLDGKPLRTPGKAELAVPAERLAEAIAAEWGAQGETIDPMSMPLTRLVNSAIDGVKGREVEVAADAARYAGSDLTCYRATYPDGLIARQRQHWDPVLAWAERDLGVRLIPVQGIMYADQPQQSLARIGELIAVYPYLPLAALHSITTLMGSVLLALAVARRHLSPEAAWEAAHVDEDWQISQWGEDMEARRRRDHRWKEMQAGALVLAALA